MKNSMTFTPTGATVNFSASTTSAGIAMDANASAIRVYNSGTTTVFVTWSRTSATASTSTSMPLPPGDVETFQKGNYDYFAGITASGTGTVYITPGEGF